jgi:hypothetical protein
LDHIENSNFNIKKKINKKSQEHRIPRKYHIKMLLPVTIRVYSVFEFYIWTAR